MAKAWPQTTIGEMLAKHGGSIKTGPFGTTLKAAEYSIEGVPLISVGEIGYGTINIHASTPRVSPKVTERLSVYLLEHGDIVFGRKGAVDRCAMVQPEQSGWFLGSDGIRLRLPKEGAVCEAKFIAYCLQEKSHRAWILAHATGTTMPSLNQDVIERIPIPLPPLPTQRAIAGVLGALDDKIEVNRRMARTLEAAARALFESWFVRFEHPATKAPAPRLVDSPMGPIPEGWSVGTIEDLCTSITSGGTPARMNPRYWENGTIPWFKTGELFDGPLLDSGEKITDAALENSSCKLWPTGTVLFALYASPTVGRFGVLTRPGTSNQAAAGLTVKPEYGVPFLTNTLFLARRQLQQIAVGAAQQNINQGVLKAHRVVIPPVRLAKAFSDLVAPMFDREVTIIEESAALSAMRDALLPKLISGELAVGQLDGSVELLVRPAVPYNGHVPRSNKQAPQTNGRLPRTKRT